MKSEDKKLWIDGEAYCIHCGSEKVVLLYENAGKILAACDAHTDMILKRIAEIRKREQS